MNTKTRSLALRCMSVVMVLGAVMFAIMLAVPATVSAGAGPKWVNGYVMDSAGRTLAGAQVSVTINGKTVVDTSDGTGYYNCIFDDGDWVAGDTIRAVAIYNSQEAVNQTTCSALLNQRVNVEYTYEIPQFGSSLGLLLAGGFVAAVSVVLLSDKKRK